MRRTRSSLARQGGEMYNKKVYDKITDYLNNIMDNFVFDDDKEYRGMHCIIFFCAVIFYG